MDMTAAEMDEEWDMRAGRQRHDGAERKSTVARLSSIRRRMAPSNSMSD